MANGGLAQEHHNEPYTPPMTPTMDDTSRMAKYAAWRDAVKRTLSAR